MGDCGRQERQQSAGDEENVGEVESRSEGEFLIWRCVEGGSVRFVRQLCRMRPGIVDIDSVIQYINFVWNIMPDVLANRSLLSNFIINL